MAGKSSIVAATLFLAAGLSAAPAAAIDDLTLTVAPGSGQVLPGASVTVTLDVANLSAAINGVQVLLRYDATLLTLVDIVPTNLGLTPPNEGWVEVIRRDNAGVLTYAAAINGGGSALDQTIATFTFTTIAEGTTSFTFRADTPPFSTKLTTAADNTTIFPTKFDSSAIVIACDDGLFCNGLETFVGGACVPGTVPCDDGVVCTVDTCDEVLDTCTNAPDNTLCDNGLFCDGAEVCDPVLDCQPGTAPCNDAITCTVDVCDEVLDTCSNTPDNTLCDDSLFCNGVEVCDPVLDCQPGVAPCNDAITCTVDTCDEVLDTCSNTPDNTLCDDALFCNGAEVCDPVLDCQPGTAPCNDGVVCTVDTCDELLDTCSNTPDNTLCDDALFCNGVETCDPLLDCVAGSDPCAPLICDEATTSCLASLRIDGLELFYAGRFLVCRGGSAVGTACTTDLDCPGSRCTEQADPDHAYLAAGSASSVQNTTNYVRGITGIRVRFDQLVSFATTPDAAFTFEWTTGSGQVFSPVTNAASVISVTPLTENGVTLVRIVIADNTVRRRWLKVTIDSTQVTANGIQLDGELTGNPVFLPSGDTVPGGNAVFYVGNASGDVDNDLKTSLADVATIRLAVNPFLRVGIVNDLDVDKDERLLLNDVAESRLDVNPFFTLPQIVP